MSDNNNTVIKSVSSNYFAIAGGLTAWGKRVLWIAAIIIVVGMFLGNKTNTFQLWNSVLVFQALLLAAYLFLTLVGSLVYFKASRIKINDVVDNAFGTEIGDSHSEKYFDNQEVTEGHKRLLFNTAESCFFSYRELKDMVGGVCVKSLIPLLILIAGLILNKAEVIMAIFRITAILVLIIQTIRFFVTINQLSSLLNRMLFTLKHKIGTMGQFTAESINYVLEYEMLMVWYGTKIPDKVYLKLNNQLTKEWETKKKSFQIK